MCPGLWRVALLLGAVSHVWWVGETVSEQWAKEAEHEMAAAASAEGRWRAALTALGIGHGDISAVAYEAEVQAGRAALNAAVQAVPEAPPIGELQQKLVLGVRGLLRRVASVVPHPRPVNILNELVMACIPPVLHRTRLRRRYQGVEDAVETGAAMGPLLQADYLHAPPPPGGTAEG